MTLLISFLHTLSAGHLPGDGLTGVVRHGDADRDLYVLGRLDWDLLADLLGQHLAAGLVTMVRSTVGRGTPDTTVDIAVGNRSVTNPLVHRVTLGLVVQLLNKNIFFYLENN